MSHSMLVTWFQSEWTNPGALPLRKNVSTRGWALTRSLLFHPCLHGSEDDSAACGGIADINGQLLSLEVAIQLPCPLKWNRVIVRAGAVFIIKRVPICHAAVELYEDVNH